jgi:hypothetical protein
MPENSYAFSGLLKNAPAYRQAGICDVIRPPHRLGGVATSRSLFVATPSGPLTFSRACQELLLNRRNDTLSSKSNFKFSCRVVFASGALHCPAFRGIQGEAISFLTKASLKKRKRGVRFRVLTPRFRVGLDDR